MVPQRSNAFFLEKELLFVETESPKSGLVDLKKLACLNERGMEKSAV
jgi:hypothetical protein